MPAEVKFWQILQRCKGFKYASSCRGKSTEFGFRSPGFEYWLSHLLPVGSWLSHLKFPRKEVFLICKMRMSDHMAFKALLAINLCSLMIFHDTIFFFLLQSPVAHFIFLLLQSMSLSSEFLFQLGLDSAWNEEHKTSSEWIPVPFALKLVDPCMYCHVLSQFPLIFPSPFSMASRVQSL